MCHVQLLYIQCTFTYMYSPYNSTSPSSHRCITCVYYEADCDPIKLTILDCSGIIITARHLINNTLYLISDQNRLKYAHF